MSGVLDLGGGVQLHPDAGQGPSGATPFQAESVLNLLGAFGKDGQGAHSVLCLALATLIYDGVPPDMHQHALDQVEQHVRRCVEVIPQLRAMAEVQQAGVPS